MSDGLRTIDPTENAEALRELWNRACPGGFHLDEPLFRQQLRLCRDPLRCLAVPGGDGELAGAVIAKRASRPGPSGRIPELGYVSFLAVAPERRRQGIGTALLDAAEAWLGETGARATRLGGDRYHLMPGRPLGDEHAALEAFARTRGFSGEGIEYDLVRSLSTMPRETPAMDSLEWRYDFRTYREGDRESLRALMEANFPGRWAQETEEALAAGMRPQDLALAVDAGSGAVAGFARIYDLASPVIGPAIYWRAAMGASPGGLGPIGVDATRRGQGLGLALMEFCVQELRARGVLTMVIDWTNLLDFYGKMGFKVWKRYELMSAETARPRRWTCRP